MNFSKLGDAVKSYGKNVATGVEDYGKTVAANAKAIVVRPQSKPTPTAKPAAPQTKPAPVATAPLDEREELIQLSRGSASQSPVHGYNGRAYPNGEPDYQHDLENGLQPRR